jgi:hypothetical protein
MESGWETVDWINWRDWSGKENELKSGRSGMKMN